MSKQIRLIDVLRTVLLRLPLGRAVVLFAAAALAASVLSGPDQPQAQPVSAAARTATTETAGANAQPGATRVEAAVAAQAAHAAALAGPASPDEGSAATTARGADIFKSLLGLGPYRQATAWLPISHVDAQAAERHLDDTVIPNLLAADPTVFENFAVEATSGSPYRLTAALERVTAAARTWLTKEGVDLDAAVRHVLRGSQDDTILIIVLLIGAFLVAGIFVVAGTFVIGSFAVAVETDFQFSCSDGCALNTAANQNRDPGGQAVGGVTEPLKRLTPVPAEARAGSLACPGDTPLRREACDYLEQFGKDFAEPNLDRERYIRRLAQALNPLG